jgi:hypothetical protein
MLVCRFQRLYRAYLVGRSLCDVPVETWAGEIHLMVSEQVDEGANVAE